VRRETERSTRRKAEENSMLYSAEKDSSDFLGSTWLERKKEERVEGLEALEVLEILESLEWMEEWEELEE